MPPDIRPLSELAEMAGYHSSATLRQAHYRGKLVCWMVAGRLVSTVDELERYLAQRPEHHQDGRTIESHHARRMVIDRESIERPAATPTNLPTFVMRDALDRNW